MDGLWWHWLMVLLPVITVTSSVLSTTDCSTLPSCIKISGTNCGWCWNDDATRNETHGGRVGTADGPTDGTCGDWTWSHSECHSHVDCGALPDCWNILGTYCGWCNTTQRGMKGTDSGPDVGKCSQWMWSHTDCPLDVGPKHVHVAYSDDPSRLVVTWASRQGDSPSGHYWPGDDPKNPISTKALTTVFTESNSAGLHYIHRTNLTGLKPGVVYEYYVQNGAEKSSTFSVTAMKSRRNTPDWVGKVLVFGDMGRHGGGFVLEALEAEVMKGTSDFALHIGDFAYDLRDSDGLNGDTFMTRIQPIAANLPYMTCTGNHENGDLSTHYRHRFSMPRHDIRSGYDMWYSFNWHGVHWIGYSSEVYFAYPNDIQRQKAWIEQDLVVANQNRATEPWVIAFGHRPMYCSNIDHDDCTKMKGLVRRGLEDVFHRGGVDLVFEAHEHSYERLWPVYNETVTDKGYVDPKSMVHLITGFAGCNENDGACLNPIKGPLGPWSAFRSSAEGEYCYGHLHVYNDTHLHWDSVLVEENNKVEDEMWLVQHHHGPRH